MRGKDWLALLGVAGGAYLAYRLYREANRYQYAGKTVLVTGGSRGLGLVLARQLVEAGASVVLCARDEDDLRRAGEELNERGGWVLTVPCDVSDPAQVDDMVREVREKRGPVDVLINNAGTITVGPLETMTLDDFHEAMNTNYWGAVHTTLAVLPEMRQRRQGRIVNVSSVGGKISVPHLLPYSASKFALTGLSEGLRSELAPEGIVVTTVCPGLMRTGSPRNANFKGRHREEYAWFSISDALTVTSMSADAAARKILHACAVGDAEVVLSLSAKFAVLVHDLAPGLTTDALALVDSLLPGPGGVGTRKVKGKDSQSEWSPSWLTRRGDRAALENNEVEPMG